MRVMIWNALFLSFVLCYQPFIDAGKKKSSSRLVKRVVDVSKEIDAHDSMAGMHMEHEQPKVDTAMAGMHMEHEQPAAVAPTVQKAEAVAPVTMQPETQPVVAQAVTAEKKVETAMPKVAGKTQQAAPDISDIDRAKQQIKEAEVELAKLKQLVIAAQAAPSIQDVQQVIELNKRLISVFDKQIREYRARGVSYADPRIKQAQQNIGVAEQELAVYEKQLKSIKSVETSVSPVTGVKKKKELKSDVQSPHAHSAESVGTKSVIVAPLAATAPGNPAAQHAHTPAPIQQKHASAVLATKPKPVSSVALAKGEAAPMSHDHGAAMPTQADAAQPHEHSGTPAATDHMHMPMDKSDSTEQSAAYKNLHAYHSQGLGPSKFKLTPFGYVQTEMSFATRQLSVIQEFQPFLVPIRTFADSSNGNDIEDRSQFIPALHAHAGTLIEGPDVLNAKATADVSLEYYSPFPLNYSPATNPGVAVRIAGIILIHASLFMEWEKTVALFGQTWHPAEDPEVSIALDRVTFFGQLADPMNRLYQIRLTQKVLPQLNFIAALTSNLDFKAAQNLGVVPVQTQNPYWLNFHFQARAKINQNVFAVAADIYTEQPRLFETNQTVLDLDAPLVLTEAVFPTIPTCAPTKAFSVGLPLNPQQKFYATKQSVTSFSMMAFAKIDRDPFVLKLKGLMGSSLGQPLGGFAILNQCVPPLPTLGINPPCDANGTNPFTGAACTIPGAITQCIEPGQIEQPIVRIYGPLRIATFAAGLYLKNKFEPGIFIGVTKNLGSKDKIWPFADLSTSSLHQVALFGGSTLGADFSTFRYVSDLDYTIVVAPRIKWTTAPVSFNLEVEYTRASFGNNTRFATIDCSAPVECLRFIFEANYNF
ncbi:MAG: hypothetical protein P4L31_02935 [Candidatus Babeliales bacterium]|nr:hypothetical protein [Candidatus Babeliales bacterium]